MSLAGCGRDRPDGSVVAVFVFIHRNPDKSHPGTVGRDLRITNPDKVKKILLGNIALLREDLAGGKDSCDQEKRQQASHLVSFQGSDFWCGIVANKKFAATHWHGYWCIRFLRAIRGNY